MVDTSKADAHEAAIAKEYSQYVAKGPIDVGGARAFNAGDPVPASSVDSGLIDKALVVGANTKTAAAVTSEKG